MRKSLVTISLLAASLMLGACSSQVGGNPVSDNYNKVLCDKIKEETSVGGRLTEMDVLYIAHDVREDLQVEESEVGSILYYAINDQCPGLWDSFYKVIEPYIN